VAAVPSAVPAVLAVAAVAPASAAAGQAVAAGASGLGGPGSAAPPAESSTAPGEGSSAAAGVRPSLLQPFGPRPDTLTPTPVTAQLSEASARAYMSRPRLVAAAAPPGLAGPDDRTLIETRPPLADPAAAGARDQPGAAGRGRDPQAAGGPARSVTLPLWLVLAVSGLGVVALVLLALRLLPS
jgi:hypothetical protein